MSNSRPPPLTLKQRLAALHNAPATPTSPTSPTSPSGKKMKLPWRRNSTDKSIFSTFTKGSNNPQGTNGHGIGHQPWSAVDSDMEERQAIQDVMSRLIFQAGVDYETRPMIVISASALPDPKRISYDLLLERILSYLNLYVESDYTVIFFAATPPGRSFTPGWNWVWKAYRGLDRKWRKNLKRLLIVHPSFFSKMLFSLAGAFISPKFNQKIGYISTLSMLAREVPLTQIDVPSAAYAENTKFEKKVELPSNGFGGFDAREGSNRVFGTPLEDIMGYDGERGGVPRVVKDCVRTLREGALQEEGIFRRSPSTSMLNAARDAYDRGNAISLSEFSRTDPHLSAVLLKKYLRDLPEPLFPVEMYTIIEQCPYPYVSDNENESTWDAIRYIRETLLPEMVPCRAILLSAALHVLHETSMHALVNKMNAYNLAVVISPNLVKGSNMMRDVQLCVVQGPTVHPTSDMPGSPSAQPNTPKTTLGTIIKLCIERYYEVFDELVDRGDALPVSRSVLRGLEEFDVQHLVREDDSERRENEAAFGVITRPNTTRREHQGERVGGGRAGGEEDDFDDAMLVMPLGPSGSGSKHPDDSRSPPSSATPYKAYTPRSQRRHSPPLPTGSSSTGGRTLSSPTSPSSYKPAHRTTLSKGSSGSSSNKIAPSSYSYSPATSMFAGGSSSTFGKAKARSVVSVDSGDEKSGTMRKGSISVGTKGSTIRGKSGASGVEAVGVLAEGFFTSPNSGGGSGS
ncbi:Rho GTPase activation protein [Flagelloscypha sp. PMI_526]|nr:Rho GTPase activation protein [Flagelloscypha sp. PMI_526]